MLKAVLADNDTPKPAPNTEQKPMPAPAIPPPKVFPIYDNKVTSPSNSFPFFRSLAKVVPKPVAAPMAAQIPIAPRIIAAVITKCPLGSAYTIGLFTQ